MWRNNEESKHIYFCLHEHAQENVADLVYIIETTLKKYHTHPFIIETIVMTLLCDKGCSKFEGNIPTATDVSVDLYDTIYDAACEQDKLGMYAMMERYIS